LARGCAASSTIRVWRKTGAEELVAKLLQDPALLKTLAATRNEPAS
jgi:hypothetical protein